MAGIKIKTHKKSVSKGVRALVKKLIFTPSKRTSFRESKLGKRLMK